MTTNHYSSTGGSAGYSTPAPGGGTNHYSSTGGSAGWSTPGDGGNWSPSLYSGRD